MEKENKIEINENSHLQEQTEKQKEALVNTIEKRKGISLWVGLEELGKAISNGSKKPRKKHNNDHQISEELEEYDKKLGEKRPPIMID